MRARSWKMKLLLFAALAVALLYGLVRLDVWWTTHRADPDRQPQQNEPEPQS